MYRLPFILLLSAVILSFAPRHSHAEGIAGASNANWQDPIDQKYRQKEPSLYKTYLDARDKIDNWDGRSELLEEAEASLDEIVKADPDYAPAYVQYGRLYYMADYRRNGKKLRSPLKDAEKAARRAIEIEPQYATAYILLARIYKKTRDFLNIEKALKTAKEIGTEDPWYYLTSADILWMKGHREEALNIYMQVVESNPKRKYMQISALTDVAACYYRLGDYDKALEWYRKIIDYAPDRAWSWGNRGSLLLYGKGDYEGAINDAEKALELMDYGAAQYLLACALYTKWAYMHADRPNSEEAKELFDRAYSLYPDIEQVIEDTRKYPPTVVTATALGKRYGLPVWALFTDVNNVYYDATSVQRLDKDTVSVKFRSDNYFEGTAPTRKISKKIMRVEMSCYERNMRLMESETTYMDGEVVTKGETGEPDGVYWSNLPTLQRILCSKGQAVAEKSSAQSDAPAAPQDASERKRYVLAKATTDCLYEASQIQQEWTSPDGDKNIPDAMKRYGFNYMEMMSLSSKYPDAKREIKEKSEKMCPDVHANYGKFLSTIVPHGATTK